MWNERYASKEFVYGTSPNAFLKEELDKLKAGKILFLCEGEGRNAVYAAQQGWEVEAFDLSEEGKKKAELLAKEKNVKFNYQLADASLVNYTPASFDVIALIYAHFPASIRQNIHQRIQAWLKPGGIVLLEAFNPAQLQNTSGGPKEISMLYTVEMLQSDFEKLKIKKLNLLSTTLSEGKFHSGKADVIRLVATQ